MQNIYRKVIEHLLKFPNTLLVNAVVRRLLKRTPDTVIKSRYGYYIHFINSNPTQVAAIRREVALGTYEKDYLAVLMRLLCLGDFVIDAGAYEGHISLLFSRAVGDGGRVFAIEPNPENLTILHNNIELNSAKNIEVIPQAIGEVIARASLYCKEKQGAYSSLFNYPHLGVKPVEVSVNTLDNLFCGKEYTGRIKLIKLDIEGAEAEAILSGTRLIAENKPYVAFEADVTCWAYQERSIESLFSTLQRMGYVVYTAGLKGRMFPFSLESFDLYQLQAMNFIAMHKSRWEL